MYDFKNLEKKWQKKWKEEKVFFVESAKRKKYYIAFVYPYMSGLLHLGHLYTYTMPEVMLRYKRMNGFNVLPKFGFHCTGTPIVAAAQRIAEKEPKQIEILKQFGISNSEIPKFSEPEYWIKYFPKETLKDLNRMGFAIDERYTFITTSLNPPYDAMVRWQFNKLKQKGYVKKGKHPVVWCPKCNGPTGDHARAEGEGETVKDFIWIKFRLKDSDLILIAGTTRPDALYGQTHIWIDPNGKYKVVNVNNEKWVVGENAVKKIEQQYSNAKVIKEIPVEELIGKWVKGPLVNHFIYIVPAWFIDSNVGSGIVYSALEDPIDLFELKKIHSDMSMLNKYHLDKNIVRKLKPISIINVSGMGENLGEEIGKEFGVKSPGDKEKIEAAKDELNKRVFRKGIMKSNCGACFGMAVREAQEFLKKHLVKNNDAIMFYELSGRVVCRCLTECIVKIVSDQWFIEYNDPEWKKLAHKCVSKMKLYPELIRKQFEYVLDWLDHWACTREFGLGTRLPWDQKWVIESLSDSTLQMAYSTISKYLEHPDDYGFKADSLNDEFFDYVFLGEGKIESIEKSTKIPKKMLQVMRNDFFYWYPFDFRNSAKDLLQNHLAFCIFNHVALFPEKHWPKAFILNGYIKVNNEKMSKSKGNFFTMRELYEKHGADAIRLTAINAGEGIDDGNFDMTFIETAKKRLSELALFIQENHNKGRSSKLNIDKWFESSIHSIIKKTADSIDSMLFKSALKYSFLDLNNIQKWYIKRTSNNPNKELINFFIETQIKLLAPFAPHFAEEMWESIGKKPFVSNAEYPKYAPKLVDEKLNFGEELIENTMSDIREVLKLAKVENPSLIELFIPLKWKYELFEEVNSITEKTQDISSVLKSIMQNPKFRQYGKDISNFLPKMLSSRKVPQMKLTFAQESSILNESVDFLKSEFKCNIKITDAESSSEPKARNSLPGKPAILVR